MDGHQTSWRGSHPIPALGYWIVSPAWTKKQGCHCKDDRDGGESRLAGIHGECAAWNQIRRTHDASRVRLSARLPIGTVSCWGLSSLRPRFSELCREKWRTQEDGTPPRGNLSTLVLKLVRCKKHVTDLLTLKRHKNGVALKHCWRGNMPVKVCAISFFSPNLHPPPSFLKNLHMARQFELASLTEMTKWRLIVMWGYLISTLKSWEKPWLQLDCEVTQTLSSSALGVTPGIIWGRRGPRLAPGARFSG